MFKKITFAFLIFTTFAILTSCGDEPSSQFSDEMSNEISTISEAESSIFDESQVESSSQAPDESTMQSEESLESDTEQSEENSETASSEAVEETSKDQSDDSSEDVYYETDDFEIPEKFKDLQSAKALKNMSKSMKSAFYIELSCDSNISGNSLSIQVKMWGDPKKGNSLSETSASANGATIIYEKKLTTGDKTYSINPTNKTYTVVEETEDVLESIIDFNSVTKVETKNELVGLEIFSTDWFILEDGSSLGIYVKEGTVRYISMKQNAASELLFELTLSKDISVADFTLPQGYTLTE